MGWIPEESLRILRNEILIALNKSMRFLYLSKGRNRLFSKNCFRANKKLRTKVMLEATQNTGKEF